MSPKIQAILDTALNQVRAALLEEASQAVHQALGGGRLVGGGGGDGGVPTPVRAKPGPKPRATTRPKGAKRTPEELENLIRDFVAQVKKTPGQSVENLAKTLGVTTKDLQLPVLKAYEAKLIKTTGQRRGTKYFPR
jgi:hypothetical protein